MALRSLGIDYDGSTLRCVLVQGDRTVLAHANIPWDGRAPLGPLLASGLGPQLLDGARLTMAFPPGIGLTRTLEFPFCEPRKLAAAVPLALAVQLPLPLDDAAIVTQQPQVRVGTASVVAAAVPRAALAQLTAPCDAEQLPLHCVDLLPSALAAGLGEQLPDGVLLVLHGAWGLVLQLQHGRLAEHRLVALPATLGEQTRLTLLEQELCTLPGGRPQALQVCGAAAAAFVPLLAGAALCAAGVESALVPALALARRGLEPGRGDSFNFRGDPLAAPAVLAQARRRLLTVAGLVSGALLVLLVSLGLRWQEQVRQADALQAELLRVYRQALPGDGPVVDVNQQLAAELAALRQGSRPGGQRPELAPLALLRELSVRTPATVGLTLRSVEIDSTTLRLEGSVPTLQGVEQLLAALSAAPPLQEVRLLDSQRNAAGTAVNFRLQAALPGTEVQP